MAEEKEKKYFDLEFHRRIAADLLKCGLDRVWFDPEKVEEISQMITREEIRIAIHKGWIRKLPIEGQSRYRAKILHEKRKKGRRRGYGKRKGKKTARMKPKRIWVYRIRKMREFLKKIKDKGLIDSRIYRKLRQMAKGGFFRTLSHLKLYVNKEILGKE